jgi:hypothetical protein
MGKRAARYQLGGLGLNVAAELVLDEAMSEGGLTYPALHDEVLRLGRLGFALFYVPEAGYKSLLYIVTHELPNGQNNFALIGACARVMIRVEAIRCIVLGKVQRGIALPLESRSGIDHLTIKELALRTIRNEEAAGLVLDAALEIGEVTHASLYREFIRLRHDHDGVIYIDETTELHMHLGDLIGNCHVDSHDLIVRIVTTLMRYYTHHTLGWESDDVFGTPTRRWYSRLRLALRR